VDTPFDTKENYEYALVFALHLSHLFGLGEFGLSVCGSCFLLRTLI
jgi:hypothetical protein